MSLADGGATTRSQSRRLFFKYFLVNYLRYLFEKGATTRSQSRRLFFKYFLVNYLRYLFEKGTSDTNVIFDMLRSSDTWLPKLLVLPLVLPLTFTQLGATTRSQSRRLFFKYFLVNYLRYLFEKGTSDTKVIFDLLRSCETWLPKLLVLPLADSRLISCNPLQNSFKQKHPNIEDLESYMLCLMVRTRPHTFY